MKYIIIFITITILILADNLNLRYFALEHNYDKYKLEKKPIFINEIFDNNFTQSSGYIKVYYLHSMIIKYENYNQENQKIFETFFDKKGRIWKGLGIDGFKYEYFYNKNMIISNDVANKKIIKSLFFNNLIVSDLEYDENNNLIKIIIYDFIKWKKRVYNKNGQFINELFLAKPNK